MPNVHDAEAAGRERASRLRRRPGSEEVVSADHRITDGVEAARFLQVVKRYLENPLTIAFA